MFRAAPKLALSTFRDASARVCLPRVRTRWHCRHPAAHRQHLHVSCPGSLTSEASCTSDGQRDLCAP